MMVKRFTHLSKSAAKTAGLLKYVQPSITTEY